MPHIPKYRQVMPFKSLRRVAVVLVLSLIPIHELTAKPGQHRGHHAKSTDNRTSNSALNPMPKGWTLHQQEQQWLLASRPFTGHSQYEYFARLTTSTPASAMLALLLDNERVPDWAHHAERAEIIADLGSGHFRVKSHFAPPWPIRNRELISESYQWQDSVGLWLEITATPFKQPPPADYVRIQQMQNCWLAQPHANGSSTLYHLGHLKDPGLTPDFLVNPAVTRSLTQTLSKLLATLPNYRNVSVNIANQGPPPNWNYCQKLTEIMQLKWPENQK